MADWGECVKDGAAQITCLEPLFTNVVRALVAFVGVALFVMLLIGGFNFLFSGGDQKKLEQANHTITAAVLGLVVIVTAYLILKTIYVFTGVDVTKFQIVQ